MKLYVFFTANTPYVAEADRTVESFTRVGVKVEKYAYQPLGDWMLNCLQKSQLTWQMAQKYPDELIGFVDADIRAAKTPTLLLAPDGDVAMHYRGDAEPEHRRCWAGAMSFAPTAMGRETLRLWAEMCKADPEPQKNIREQVYLTRVIEQMRKCDGFRLVNIGDAYYRPAGEVRLNDGTVLIHFECSRFYIKQVGGKLVDHSKWGA